MPAYSKENEQRHMERVREVLALKPRAGAITISNILKGDPNDPLSLDPHYVIKLKKKIAGERKHRFNQALVDEHIAEMEDAINELVVRMWAIVLDSSIDERARVGAAKVIVDSKVKLFEAKMDAGIFERKLGTFEVRKTYELKAEQKILILNALENYGIVPKQNNGNGSEKQLN